MQLEHARILLTGASGGLGKELALQLSSAGASILLAGRDEQRLNEIRHILKTESAIIRADLNDEDGIAATAEAARRFGVNVLINNAGAGAFGLLENQEWSSIARVLATSLEAPIHMTHTLLPWLRAQPRAAIVNIGSVFGSLPFPGFATYSAAKAGLRGFSQALRRELANSSISVIHVSPRAIDTAMNDDTVNALNRELGNQSDSPKSVARRIVAALASNAAEQHLGFPEGLFAWLNGVAPGLIDRGLIGKLSVIERHAAPQNSPRPTPRTPYTPQKDAP